MINANNSIITVMTTLVGQMTPLCTITTNAASGTNWQLDMCATFWLNVGSTVTIGGVVFTVVSYVKDTSITVSGAAQPIGTTFVLNAPEFSHGSHRKVDNERKAPNDLVLPFVYLPVPEVTEPNGVNDDIAYTALIRPIFLIEYDEGQDEITLQQNEIIEPCNEMADFFAWLIEDQQDNFERPEDLTRKEWMNFGDPTTWGNDKLIFEQKLSGVELRMTLEVSYDAPCLCEAATPSSCAAVRVSVDGVYTEDVASGGEYDCITGGGSPVQNSMNAAELTEAVSGTTKTFVVTYADLSAVVVTETSDSATAYIGTVPNPVVPLNTANIFKTGATTSFQSQDDGDKEFGRGVNLTTLDFNNGFGNTDRFTDDLGTQIYASLVIIDWSTWDNVNNTVLAYYKTPEASATLTNQLNGQPYTKNALSNWWVCNIKELMNVNNYEITRDYLNYAPFNFAYLATTDRLWVSTRDSAGVGIFSGNTSISVGGQSGVYKALLCRTYTMAELSL